MDSGRFRKWRIIIQDRTWIIIVRKPRLLEMVWSTITRAKLSSQFPLNEQMIDDKTFDVRCEQNTA